MFWILLALALLVVVAISGVIAGVARMLVNGVANVLAWFAERPNTSS